MKTTQARPRLRVIAFVAVAALLGLIALRIGVTYLSRDRWGQDPSQVAGTRFQFVPAQFYVFNETGHEIVLRVSASGRVLFEQRLPAERQPEITQGHTVHEYTGRYPYAHVQVREFDSLTRSLEVTELPEGRTQTVDLASLPTSEAGDFSIRLTGSGCIVRRAKYAFI